MILGIDASNLHTGGSITHLSELLRSAEPHAFGFSKVVVWSGKATLAQIDDRPWLLKRHQPQLDGHWVKRAVWQRFELPRVARKEACESLFVPGGSFAGNFRPVITMSRNMLPFEWREAKRYGMSWMTLKLMLLRLTQTRSYVRANGIIFLTQYALDGVMRVVGRTSSKISTVPHGVDARFVQAPRAQKAIQTYSAEKPYRILYVSTIDMYKHHDAVVSAVAMLRDRRHPVVVDLVGATYGPAMRRLEAVLDRVDPKREWVVCHGKKPYLELHAIYAQADLCIFASSCENMPNTLLEGMASGLPIACSNRGPMPEVLGDAGLYFDPEDPVAIATALQRLVESPALRQSLATASFERSRAYSWRRCAHETFSFVARVTSEFQR